MGKTEKTTATYYVKRYTNSLDQEFIKALKIYNDTVSTETKTDTREITHFIDDAGYGKDYKYAHDFEGHFADQEFLPEGLSGTRFYEPDLQNASEQKIAERIRTLWKGKY